MKGEVICPFRDKFHYNTLYEIGTVVDFDEERMADLFARKLCKKIEGEEETSSPAKKSDKADKKKSKVKKDEPSVEETAEADESEAIEEQVSEELDEKTKSEQEAAKKIAEATQKANEK